MGSQGGSQHARSRPSASACSSESRFTGYAGSAFRVLSAPAALSGPAHPLARIALSLGQPATATGRQIIEAVVAARGRPGIPPVTVPAESAPCKQNVVRRADIDLYQFPTPLIHGNDGGRYIQTYGMNIVTTRKGPGPTGRSTG